MKIEPCPFCGGEASVVQFVGDLYVVKCDYCFVRTSKYSEKEKAISAWNRRKAPEIIFCKDCIRRRKNTLTGKYYCRASGLRNTDYDFCSGGKRAERRADG